VASKERSNHEDGEDNLVQLEDPPFSDFQKGADSLFFVWFEYLIQREEFFVENLVLGEFHQKLKSCSERSRSKIFDQGLVRPMF